MRVSSTGLGLEYLLERGSWFEKDVSTDDGDGDDDDDGGVTGGGGWSLRPGKDGVFLLCTKAGNESRLTKPGLKEGFLASRGTSLTFEGSHLGSPDFWWKQPSLPFSPAACPLSHFSSHTEEPCSVTGVCSPEE